MLQKDLFQSCFKHKCVEDVESFQGSSAVNDSNHDLGAISDNGKLLFGLAHLEKINFPTCRFIHHTAYY